MNQEIVVWVCKVCLTDGKGETCGACGSSMGAMAESTVEAFRQGQRDREQNWPDLARQWNFTGLDNIAYQRGRSMPRTGDRT